MKKNKLRSLLFIGLTVISVSVFAQKVGKVELKDNGFTQKKFNMAEKKIFIQQFNVNYQMMYGRSETVAGGREAGGGHRGKAKASLTLGVQGVEAEMLQEMTNSFYKKYLESLQKAGFTIVTADEVKEHEYFTGWQMIAGGTPSEAQLPGYVSTSPDGFSYLVKGVSKSGKQKKTKSGAFDQGGMQESSNTGGIIVARVNVAVPFATNGESQGSRALTKSFGGVAKVVIEPELIISPMETIMQEGDFKKPLYSYSEVIFAYKENLKKQALFKMSLKKPIKIDGVFEDKKYKAIKSADQDLWGSSIGALTVFSVEDRELESVQPVSCNPETYKKGVSQGISSFINNSVDEFLTYIK